MQLAKAALEDPSILSSAKLCAQALHLNYNATKRALHLYRKKAGTKGMEFLLCPLCLSRLFEDGNSTLVCHACGFEYELVASSSSIAINDNHHENVFRLSGGLGTAVDYSELNFKYGGQNIEHLINAGVRSPFSSLLSALMERLKGLMPSDRATERAYQLLSWEYRDASVKFPTMLHSRTFRAALIDNVIRRLRKEGLLSANGSAGDGGDQ
jgi:hypothetical protein